jgi:integrase
VAPTELQAFLAHTRDDRWYPVWHVLAATGMRRSEVCGLRSESVDLERGVITVDWKVVSVHNVPYEGNSKSELSIREITIDDQTVAVLPTGGRSSAATAARRRRRGWRRGYEFTDEIGRGIHSTRLSTNFTKALKSSGVLQRYKVAAPRRATPHGLRHLPAPPARRRRPRQGRQRPPRPRLRRVQPGPFHQGHRTRRPRRRSRTAHFVSG